jgi:hypothetical protein
MLLLSISGSENEELRILNDIFQKFKEKMTEHLQNQTLFDDDFPYELLHDLKNILSGISPKSSIRILFMQSSFRPFF